MHDFCWIQRTGASLLCTQIRRVTVTMGREHHGFICKWSSAHRVLLWGKANLGVETLGSGGCWWISHDTPVSHQGFLSQLQVCGQFSCIQLLSQRPALSCLPAWFCQGSLLCGSAIAADYWTPQNQQAPCRSLHPLLLPLLPGGKLF